MIFVGFGFLMTFLKRYSYSAVALNFVLSALAMLMYLLVGGAIQQFLWPEGGSPPKGGKIELDLPLLIGELSPGEKARSMEQCWC